MPIQVIRQGGRQPQADIRFLTGHLLKPDPRRRLQTYTEPFRDRNGSIVIEAYLDMRDYDSESLRDSYLRMMLHALRYPHRSVLIPLYPENMDRKERLTAACGAFLEISDGSVEVLLELDDREPLTGEEETILAVTNYIEQTHDDFGEEAALREEELPQYDAGPVSLRLETETDVLMKADLHFSADPDTGDVFEKARPSGRQYKLDIERFDPVRGAFRLDAGFGETLLELIRAKGMTEAECYNKANVTRAAFYKIRQSARDPGSSYRPSKQTALALAVALELDLEQTEDLLRRAGYSLSHSSRADVIVEYFLRNGIHDLFEINEVLYEFDQQPLGVQ